MRLQFMICTIILSATLTTHGFGQEPARSDEPTAATIRNQANIAYGNKNYTACANLYSNSASLASAAAAVNDYYNAACCYGLGENVDKAFAMLERAIKAGYSKKSHVKGDSDFDNLHTDARWEKLLATIVVPVIKITDNLTTDPKKSQFVYDDIHNFIRAMTLVKDGDDPTEILTKEYFGKGTPGLKQFVKKYGLTAEAIAAALKKRPEKYALVSEWLAQLKSREKDMRKSYVQFKQIVPQAVFPPTYFLVSDYGGIASGSPDGQLITIERRTRESIDKIETLLVHELLHFQQLVAVGPDEFYALFGEKKTLLGLTIREGAAEFVAKRITGRITQQDAYDYVIKYEREIWQRFQPQMLGRKTSDWMWSTPDNPDQPRDVAYALGSRIVEAYYDSAIDRAIDKRQAMQDILSVIDYPQWLKRSGYAAKFSSPGSNE